MERAVGEQAVVADRDPEGGQHVHHAHDRQIGAVHGALPEQDDRENEGGERDYDGSEAHVALCTSHDQGRYWSSDEPSSCVTQNLVRFFVTYMSTLEHEPWRELPPSLATLIT